MLARLMSPPQPSKLREWADFNAATTSDATRGWWAAYTAAYDTCLKWSKKPTHAPFCYELLVTMLALAASDASAAPVCAALP